MGISLESETAGVLPQRTSSATTAATVEVCSGSASEETCQRQARWADLIDEDAQWADLSNEEDDREYAKMKRQDVRQTKEGKEPNELTTVACSPKPRASGASAKGLRWCVKASQSEGADIPCPSRGQAHPARVAPATAWSGGSWGGRITDGWSKGWAQTEGEDEKSWCVSRPQKDLKKQCQYIIGIEEDKAFRVGRRLLGPSGQNMKEVAEKTGARLRLRGRGSRFLEGPDQEESKDPLMLCVSAPTEEGYSQALELIESLLQRVYAEYAEFCREAGRPVPKLRLRRHEGARWGSR